MTYDKRHKTEDAGHKTCEMEWTSQSCSQQTWCMLLLQVLFVWPRSQSHGPAFFAGFGWFKSMGAGRLLVWFRWWIRERNWGRGSCSGSQGLVGPEADDAHSHFRLDDAYFAESCDVRFCLHWKLCRGICLWGSGLRVCVCVSWLKHSQESGEVEVELIRIEETVNFCCSGSGCSICSRTIISRVHIKIWMIKNNSSIPFLVSLYSIWFYLTDIYLESIDYRL